MADTTTVTLTDEQKQELTAAVIKAVLEQSEPIQDFERVTTATGGLSIPFVDEEGNPKVADISAIIQNSSFTASVAATGKYNNVITGYSTGSGTLSLTLGDLDAASMTYSGVNLGEELDRLELAVWMRSKVSLKAVMAASTENDEDEDGSYQVQIYDDGTVCDKGMFEQLFTTVPVCAQVVISDDASEWALISSYYSGGINTRINFQLKDYGFVISRAVKSGGGYAYMATWWLKTDEQKANEQYDSQKLYDALFVNSTLADNHIKQLISGNSGKGTVTGVNVDGASVVDSSGEAWIDTSFAPTTSVNSGKAVPDNTVMPNAIGGLDKGTSVGTLRGYTVSDILYKMLFPDSNPEVFGASYTFRVGTYSSTGNSTQYIRYGSALPTGYDIPTTTKAYYTINKGSKIYHGGEPDKANATYAPAEADMPTGTAQFRQKYTYQCSLSFAKSGKYALTAQGLNYTSGSLSPYQGETIAHTLTLGVTVPVRAWITNGETAPATAIPAENASGVVVSEWDNYAPAQKTTGKITTAGDALRLYVAAPFTDFKVGTVKQKNSNNSDSTIAMTQADDITDSETGLAFKVWRSDTGLSMAGATLTIPMSGTLPTE